MDISLALLMFLCFLIHTSYRIVVNKAMCHVIRCVRKGALKSRQAFYHLRVHIHMIRISSIFNRHSRTCVLILEGEEGREREKHQLVAFFMQPTGGQTHNLVVRVLTRKQTRILLLPGMTFQHTDPHSRGRLSGV